eukprot:TRINITY_DN13671_c0_g3_i1.p1 TRINITY_DN13671_c0_g3~~TRINITY_DN13671_c0_g3_i1.p1  ORF type:complete len:303 (+),score=92.22 TRINITY_DN13671_c0_g3_i1:99-1007(+)
MVLNIAVARGTLSTEDSGMLRSFVDRFKHEIAFVLKAEQTLSSFDVLVQRSTALCSPKVLLALLLGAPIVDASWPAACVQRGELCMDQLWPMAEQSPRWGGVNIAYARGQGALLPLKGRRVFVAPRGTNIPHRLLQHVAALAGATVVEEPHESEYAVMSRHAPLPVPPGVQALDEHWVVDVVCEASQRLAKPFEEYRVPEAEPRQPRAAAGPQQQQQQQQPQSPPRSPEAAPAAARAAPESSSSEPTQSLPSQETPFQQATRLARESNAQKLHELGLEGGIVSGAGGTVKKQKRRRKKKGAR